MSGRRNPCTRTQEPVYADAGTRVRGRSPILAARDGLTAWSYRAGLVLLSWAIVGCGAGLGADLDLRWQSCAGTVRLMLEPGVEAGEVVERAVVTCDGVELLRPVCAEPLEVEYLTLPGGRLGVVLRCGGVAVFSTDGAGDPAPVAP